MSDTVRRQYPADVRAVPHPASKALSRRTLVQGAAWAVPAVVVAGSAPAFAVSNCPVSTVTFPTTSGTTGTTSFTGTSDANGGGTTVTASNTVSGTVTRATTNMTTTTSYGSSMVNLQQNPANTTSYQELTFTFSQPVYNVSFWIYDIDYNNNIQMGGYIDNVAVSKINGSAPTSGSFTGTKNDSTMVAGSGTLTDPWKPSATNTAPLDPSVTSTRVNVKLAPTTATTSFTIRYWNTYSGTHISQQVLVGGITFTTTNCQL